LTNAKKEDKKSIRVIKDLGLPSLERGLYAFGNPSECAPAVMVTNYMLQTIATDSACLSIDCFLIVVDTKHLPIWVAFNHGLITPENFVEQIKYVMEASGIEGKLNHRKLIIPGPIARFVENLLKEIGWEVVIGPEEAIDILEFVASQ
jgi:acetyl-CoA decarbonylase/synthase complex subunit gamma